MPPLVHGEEEVNQLQALTHSGSLPHLIVQHAQIVLA